MQTSQLESINGGSVGCNTTAPGITGKGESCGSAVDNNSKLASSASPSGDTNRKSPTTAKSPKTKKKVRFKKYICLQ